MGRVDEAKLHYTQLLAFDPGNAAARTEASVDLKKSMPFGRWRFGAVYGSFISSTEVVSQGARNCWDGRFLVVTQKDIWVLLLGCLTVYKY